MLSHGGSFVLFGKDCCGGGPGAGGTRTGRTADGVWPLEEQRLGGAGGEPFLVGEGQRGGSVEGHEASGPAGKGNRWRCVMPELNFLKEVETMGGLKAQVVFLGNCST